MDTKTHPARRRGHLSRYERQRLVRAAAFSRRTPALLPAVPPATLERNELEPIDRLVRHDRTAVSSASSRSPASAPAKPCASRSLPASARRRAGRRPTARSAPSAARRSAATSNGCSAAPVIMAAVA
jgi:hypothetical protein